MINILIGNRDSKKTKSLEKQLTNDKKYMINYVYSGKDTIEMYWKLNPDILVLDGNLQDMFFVFNILKHFFFSIYKF